MSSARRRSKRELHAIHLTLNRRAIVFSAVCGGSAVTRFLLIKVQGERHDLIALLNVAMKSWIKL